MIATSYVQVNSSIYFQVAIYTYTYIYMYVYIYIHLSVTYQPSLSAAMTYIHTLMVDSPNWVCLFQWGVPPFCGMSKTGAWSYQPRETRVVPVVAYFQINPTIRLHLQERPTLQQRWTLLFPSWDDLWSHGVPQSSIVWWRTSHESVGCRLVHPGFLGFLWDSSTEITRVN